MYAVPMIRMFRLVKKQKLIYLKTSLSQSLLFVGWIVRCSDRYMKLEKMTETLR